jgi:polar amino acid transport system substrate-binding protein
VSKRAPFWAVVVFICNFAVLTEPFAAEIFPSNMLIVGIDDSPPYSFFNKEGKADGTFVELLDELSDNAGTSIRYVQCPWARCIRLVESGQINLLAGLSKSLEREALLYFVEPPILIQKASFGFYTLPSHQDIQSYADLSGLIIGKLRGSQHFDRFDNDTSLTTVEAQDIKTLFLLLKNERIDAIIHLHETFIPYLKQYDPNHEVHKTTYEHKVEALGYVVLSKISSTTAMHKRLNQAMLKLSLDGRIKELIDVQPSN